MGSPVDNVVNGNLSTIFCSVFPLGVVLFNSQYLFLALKSPATINLFILRFEKIVRIVLVQVCVLEMSKLLKFVFLRLRFVLLLLLIVGSRVW